MNRLRLPAAAAVVALVSATSFAGPDGCGVCHGAERVEFGGSVHDGSGFGCTTCHGGDGSAVTSKDAAHDAAKGFRGAVPRSEIAAACGGCHSDVRRMRPYGLRTDALAAWQTSAHGRAVQERGDPDAATCTDCHGVHAVLRVKDGRSPVYRTNVPATCGRCHADAARMARHGLPTAVVPEFAASIHGTKLAKGDPGVPSCADCHDGHAAAPPGAAEAADVCGSCHRESKELYEASPHAGPFSRGEARECLTCHGSHAVARAQFGLFDAAPDEPDDARRGVRCLSCHHDAADRGAAVAREFGEALRDAGSELAGAEARVAALAIDGFHVGWERETLERARRELVRAVPLTHTADPVRVEGAVRHARSLVAETVAGCAAKARDARDRRLYGTGIALALLAASSFLLVRRRERP